jgi:hypothetical protein
VTPGLRERLADAVPAFDVGVRRLRVTRPAGVGRHFDVCVCCHPFVTTEADSQRWFSAAMDRTFEDMSVHAEVYAFARRCGVAASCAPRSARAHAPTPIAHDETFRSPLLLSYVPIARADGFRCRVALLMSTSAQEVL